MSRNTQQQVTVGEWRPVKRRIIEVAVGLFIVLAMIVLTRLWIGWENADRADTVALRRCLALTLDAARKYRLDEQYSFGSAEALQRFLSAQHTTPLPLRPAHEFVDSFLVYYQDGIIDSLEATALYRRLPDILPAGE